MEDLNSKCLYKYPETIGRMVVFTRNKELIEGYVVGASKSLDKLLLIYSEDIRNGHDGVRLADVVQNNDQNYYVHIDKLIFVEEEEFD